ncbi:MAG: TetR-like C-terminal domain-containing protein [Coriobacteriales bacterium]|nr:TetR-like C-terminal domain-containing protein [Coriobacteriales bacterium]
MRSTDRRCQRTRVALREALAQEIKECGDLSKVTVTGVTRRADVTRRTFYSHYRDIPTLVAAIEDETIEDLSPLVRAISEVTLPELEQALKAFEPCPRSIEVLKYVRENGELLSALLGEGGDPAFASKLQAMVRDVVEDRARAGFSPVVAMGFDYYLTFVIAAEVGVLIRWLCRGMEESEELMARIMTALMFVRPGDLYNRPIDFDLPLLSVALTDEGKELVHG